MEDFIKNLKKAELHLHIEGTLEPELMFKLAKKNGVKIPYGSIEEVKNAYNFTSLQSFLDIYYAGANVLIEEEDFFELTWAYLLKCKEQNIVHTEIMFDPQTHTKRGISFGAVINGITKALQKADEELGISSCLIMSFLRHLSEEEAINTLKEALPYKYLIKAVGLDSSEVGNPPSKFQKVFTMAKNAGFKLVAHAGEEANSSYIWEAIELLHVHRIDHGIRCDEDEKLLEYLKEKQIPLTVCPLSNVKLRAVKDLASHNIKKLLDMGLCVTINSDDPAYFGGYLNENFIATAKALNLEKNDIKKMIDNAFKASFKS
ncbi:adenosine deaminase [Sulfurospirillum sp. 1307]